MTGIKKRLGSLRGPQGSQGQPGERGLPGVNAVPADQAVADYISRRETSTRQALSAAVTAVIAADQTVIQAAEQAMSQVSDGALTYNTVMRDRGDYDPEVAYYGGDIVTHGENRYYAAAGEGTVTQVRTNHLPNPRFANNRTGWVVSTGVNDTVDGTNLQLDLTSEKGATNALLTGPEVTTIAGGQWAGSVRVAVPADATAPVGVRLNLTHFPSPGSTPIFKIETIHPGESKVVEVNGSITPADKTALRLVLSAGTTALPAGTALTVSQPIVEESPTIGSYFDGSTTGTDTTTYAWAGSVDSSVSTATAIVSASPDFGVPGADQKWVKISEPGSTVDPDTITDTVKAITSKHEAGYSALIPTIVQAEQTRPLGYIKGVFYGTSAGGAFLRYSTDQGRTWTNIGSVAEVGSTYVASLLDTGDGEVLLVAEDQIWKSTGWGMDPVTASWEPVLEAPSPSVFHAYGVDTDPATGRCFATTYSNNAHGPDWSNSRYGWLSTDHGATWRVAWDKNTRLNSQDLASKSHNHLAAIDPWANGRLWVSWHTDGTPTQQEVCYSDDDGETWIAITSSHQPQSGAAAKHGMVFGSDDAENGIHVVERTDDPADMEYKWVWEWKNYLTDRLVGHSNRSFRDDETGTVYTGFMVSISGGTATSTIAESNGRTAWGVWEHPDPKHYGSGEGIRGRLVVGQGVLMAQGWWDSANHTVILGRVDHTIQSPNGTSYRITVSDTGDISVIPA